MHVQEMIATHPKAQGSLNDALIRCIEECYDCAQICTACADACLGEDMVSELVQCIRLDLDCADICATTGQAASRRTGANERVVKQLIETCMEACRLCADECERHAERHEHCRICADACRRCESACGAAAGSLSPTLQ
jgi:hypothetical protein